MRDISLLAPQRVLRKEDIFRADSIASFLSLLSAGSILSIASAGSLLSIGSTGSLLSIGSVGLFPGKQRR